MTEQQDDPLCVVKTIQQQMGYRKGKRACVTCSYLKRNPKCEGYICNRNPDVSFSTSMNASCDKWLR